MEELQARHEEAVEVIGAAERVEAENVLQCIEADIRAANLILFDMCEKITLLRDKKLYRAAGYETFEDCMMQRFAIGKRQAEKYIGLYKGLDPRLLKEHSEIGVEKLDLLRQLPAPDRAEFAEENDLTQISVREMQELIDRANGQAEQITMLEAEKEDAEKSEAWLKKHMKELEERLAQAEGDQKAALDRAAQKAGAEKERAMEKAAQKARAEKEQAVKEAYKKGEEAAKAGLEKRLKEAEEKGREAAAALAQQQRADLEREADGLRRKLETATDRDTVYYAALFDQMQATANRMMDKLQELYAAGQTEKADRLAKTSETAVRMVAEKFSKAQGGAKCGA